MLIPGLTILALGFLYITRQAIVAELVANKLEAWTEVALRLLRSHAAAQRASEAAYRIEWAYRWNQPKRREVEVSYWTEMAKELFG